MRILILFLSLIFSFNALADAGCGSAPWYDLFCNYYTFALTLGLSSPLLIIYLLILFAEHLKFKKVKWLDSVVSATLALFCILPYQFLKKFNQDYSVITEYLILGAVFSILYIISRKILLVLPAKFRKRLKIILIGVATFMLITISIVVYSIVVNNFLR